MKKINAGDFSTRGDLEQYVRNTLGLTTELKKAVIRGTEEELKRLHLAAHSRFWGIGCEVIAGKRKAKAAVAVPDRGPFHPSGIDETLKDKKGNIINNETN